MKCSLTLTATAGVIGAMGGFSFLLDALHMEPTAEFSSLTPETAERALEEMVSFPPEAVLVTHDHRDHFYKPLVDEALRRFPDSRLVMPALAPSVVSGVVRSKSASVRFQKLTHQMARKLGDPANYGFLIESGGKTLLTAGDATPFDERIFALTGGRAPDVALLDFPWLTTRRGQEMLNRLAPRRIVLFHLPYPEEDRCGYCAAATSAAEKYPADVDVLLHFLQRVELDI